MTKLLEWREETRNKTDFFFRVVATELGAICLILSDLVETVVYSVLAGINLLGGGGCIRKIVDNPTQLLASSAFTLFWVVTTALFSNLFRGHLESNESLARMRLNSCCCPVLRNIDRTSLPAQQELRVEKEQKKFQEKAQEAREKALKRMLAAQMPWRRELESTTPPPLPATRELDPAQQRWQEQLAREISQSQESCRSVDYSGDVFLLELLRRVDLETKEGFCTYDREIIFFIMSKGIFEYTLGAKRRERIPRFFGWKTQSEIRKLRNDAQLQRDERVLKVYFCAPVQDGYAMDDKLKCCSASLGKLKGAWSSELQNGRLLCAEWNLPTTCWQRVVGKVDLF